MADLYVAEQAKNAKRKTQNVEEPKEEPSVHRLPGHTHNPLAAYCYKPDGVFFETQEQQEEVVLLLRQHPITNIPWILVAIVLFLAPNILGQFPLISFLPERFQTASILLWYLVVTAYVFEKALAWFFNVYILTDERIIDVDFYDLIYRAVSDAKTSKVQDVTYKVGGVVGTIFNFGDVFIQTAGTLPNFDFLKVPNPEEVARILQELQTEEEVETLEGRVR